MWREIKEGVENKIIQMGRKIKQVIRKLKEKLTVRTGASLVIKI